jgi:hypothetical protein
MTQGNGHVAGAGSESGARDREFGKLDWLLLVVLLVATMAVAYLTAMAIWRFAEGSFLLGFVKYSLLLLANLAIGALAAGLWIEWQRPRRSKFGKRQGDGDVYLVRPAKLITGVVALVLLTGVEFWVLGVIHTDLLRDFLLVIGCLLIGAAACAPWRRSPFAKVRLAVWPNRLDGYTGPWLGVRLFLAPLSGVMLGVVASASWYLGNAYYTNRESASAAMPTYRIPLSGGYLALGDSYSAGEGLGPFQGAAKGISPDTNLDNCHRSTAEAYAEVIPVRSGGHPLHLGGPSSNSSFRACSSAVISDIFAKRRGSPYVAAQVTLGVVPRDPALVTITIGGNDALFSKIVGNCFLVADCRHEHFPPNVPPPPPPGRPRYLSYRPFKGPLDTWAPQMIAVVGDNELTLFKALRADFPHARIIVLGYPYLFPPPSRTAGLWPTYCNSFLRRYSPAIRGAVRHWEDEFNARIYEAAAIAKVEFISPVMAWRGHEPCGVDGQFLHSIKPALNFPVPLDGGSFHPNQSGQRVYAALLDCYLYDHPQKPPPYVLPGSRLPRTLPASLQWPSRLGLKPPPGLKTALPGCGTW